MVLPKIGSVTQFDRKNETENLQVAATKGNLNGHTVRKGDSGCAGLALLGLLFIGGAIACAALGATRNAQAFYAGTGVLGVAGVVTLCAAIPFAASNRQRDNDAACCLLGTGLACICLDSMLRSSRY